MRKLVSLLKKYPEYKELALNTMKNKISKLQERINNLKIYIDNFYRPSREEHINRAPYRGAPIKPDQAYQSEKNNAKLELDMNTKNLELIQGYMLKIT